MCNIYIYIERERERERDMVAWQIDPDPGGVELLNNSLGSRQATILGCEPLTLKYRASFLWDPTVCLYVFLSPCLLCRLCLSVSSVSLSLSVSIYLSLSLSIYLSISLSASLGKSRQSPAQGLGADVKSYLKAGSRRSWWLIWCRTGLSYDALYTPLHCTICYAMPHVWCHVTLYGLNRGATRLLFNICNIRDICNTRNSAHSQHSDTSRYQHSWIWAAARRPRRREVHFSNITCLTQVCIIIIIIIIHYYNVLLSI